MRRERGYALVLLGLAVFLSGCPTSGGGEYGPCVPDCESRNCGDDGCGGSCGDCRDQRGPDQAGAAPDITAEFDITIPDASSAKICQSLYLQFQTALEAGVGCLSALDCRHQVVAGDPCHCALFVSDPGTPAYLAALEKAYVDQGCSAREMCDACPWAELPVCNHGACAPSMPACPELAGQYQQALLVAGQCEADGDCTGQVAGSLDCDCAVPINGSAWTGYFDLAAELWNSSDCGPPRDCSCVEISAVRCLDGLCVTAAKPPSQSQDCAVAEDCIPVSGCACGCWSVPPQPESPECPCAAPMACDCVSGSCQPAS